MLTVQGRIGMKLFAVVLLVAGIACVAYPSWDKHIQQKKQLELLTAWHFNEHAQTEPLHVGTQMRTAQAVSAEQTDSASTSAISRAALPEIDGMPMLGTIQIEKIDLLEPILAGTTEKTLKVGVGTVTAEREPGRIGNFALAGHRSWTHGKQFSRLDEMETDDRIVVETRDATFTYVVTDVFLVEPHETYVLDATDDMAEITLITCEPMRNPTHRLIVKAVMQEQAAEL